MNKILDEILNSAREKTKNGHVATYIPGLSKGNRDHLGICMIDMDGSTECVGDFDVKFTIQSVSKPITLMLAILDHGIDHVFKKVGMEPTGDPFNSIIRLETNEYKGKPSNPMINAGAIQICSMIKGEGYQEKFKRVLDFFRLVSENPELGMSEEIFQDEMRTGDRNRSLAYFLKCEGLLESSVEDTLEIYFRQCSIEVTARDLAKMALFLARDGVLSTGERIVDKKVCRIVKSLMVTCGMYDGSGEFATIVGIPSKSGVGGGIMSVVPGQLGIGVFGPALDVRGNSIGGVNLLKKISKEYGLTIF